MNACPPDDLSAYEQPTIDSVEALSVASIVGDADESSDAPTAPLEGESGMPWIGPDPLD
jgi:hypothetical protein